MTPQATIRTAQPSPAHPIVDRHGSPCPSYVGRDPRDVFPLRGVCSCGASITVADGSADWAHVGNGQRRCDYFAAGCRVRLVLPSGHPLFTTKWYPAGEVTATVERTFKNGLVAVAVDQLGNRSDDRRRTLHVDRAFLEVLP